MIDRHALSCPCSCHGRGPHHPCDFDGGCGHLHDHDRPALDATSRCLIDRRRTRRDGGLTCWRCHDLLADMLDIDNEGDDEHRLPASVPVLFARLSPRPARGEGGGRRAPGFAAALPISPHHVALRDPRSRPQRVAPTWQAHDGTTEHEQENPPLHAGNVLAGWARVVADERPASLPTRHRRPRDSDHIGPMTHLEHRLSTLPLHDDVLTIAALAVFLRRHLDWITRQPWIDEAHAEIIAVRDQLRPATGDPRPRSVGPCPNTLDDGEHTRECAAPLRVPAFSDSVRCTRCARTWTRAEWLQLGDLLQTQKAARSGDVYQ